ncbi:hypothetical protein wTpre_996B, partial [Wolbachia endosymbiont of Trichogramma pretiosum]
KITTSSL